jgi:hypothetical protein
MFESEICRLLSEKSYGVSTDRGEFRAGVLVKQEVLVRSARRGLYHREGMSSNSASGFVISCAAPAYPVAPRNTTQRVEQT